MHLFISTILLVSCLWLSTVNSNINLGKSCNYAYFTQDYTLNNGNNNNKKIQYYQGNLFAVNECISVDGDNSAKFECIQDSNNASIYTLQVSSYNGVSCVNSQKHNKVTIFNKYNATNNNNNNNNMNNNNLNMTNNTMSSINTTNITTTSTLNPNTTTTINPSNIIIGGNEMDYRCNVVQCSVQLDTYDISLTNTDQTCSNDGDPKQIGSVHYAIGICANLKPETDGSNSNLYVKYTCDGDALYTNEYADNLCTQMIGETNTRRAGSCNVNQTKYWDVFGCIIGTTPSPVTQGNDPSVAVSIYGYIIMRCILFIGIILTFIWNW